MKLYKFRPLANQIDFDRAKIIIETGHFWCSKFSELNDPMEGVFYIAASCNETAHNTIGIINDAKNRYKIGAFSAFSAFEHPVMWGYYANGFKGIAIEIEVDEGIAKEVNYAHDIPTIEHVASATNADVEKILRTKLVAWSCESEYRFLKESENNFHKIGYITAVYFGDPYGNTINAQDVYDRSPALGDYNEFKLELKKVVHSIPCFNIKFSGGKVEQGSYL